MAAGAIALIPMVIQVLPGLIDGFMKIVDAIRKDPTAMADPATKVMLEALAARLHATANAVEAVLLPNPQPGNAA